MHSDEHKAKPAIIGGSAQPNGSISSPATLKDSLPVNGVVL